MHGQGLKMGGLEDALVFYRRYHRNKWNQVIHVVFVPAIMWTVLVWLAYTPPLASVPETVVGRPWAELLHKCALLI